MSRPAGLLLFLLCAAAVAGCGQEPSSGSASVSKPEAPVLKAAVFTADESVWPTIVRTQGSLVADEVAIVGTRVAGRVKTVHVDLGDLVRTGNPLVTLDDEEFRLQVSQAEAQLAQARAAVGLQPGDSVAQLDREKSPPVRQEKAVWDEAKEKLQRAQLLRARNAVSESELEQLAASERVAAARHASALNSVDEKIALIGVREAELGLARQRLEDSVIRAPFDGQVQQRQVAPGVFVSLGQSIATLVRTHPLRYRGTMPERYAQQMRLGQKVTLEIESIAEPRTVKITRISPALNELSRALLFEAVVDNADGRLRTGLFAEGEVVLDPRAQALVVPRSAVVEFAGAEKVWKVVDGRASEQKVRTGMRRGNRVVVLEGLSPGDRILANGSEGRVARVEPILPERPLQPTASSEPADPPAEPVSE